MTIRDGIGFSQWAESNRLGFVNPGLKTEEPLFSTPEHAQLYKLAVNSAQLAAVAEEALSIAEAYGQASYDNRKAMRKRTRLLRQRLDDLVPED